MVFIMKTKESYANKLMAFGIIGETRTNLEPDKPRTRFIEMLPGKFCISKKLLRNHNLTIFWF